jgi:hypothetical protein
MVRDLSGKPTNQELTTLQGQSATTVLTGSHLTAMIPSLDEEIRSSTLFAWGFAARASFRPPGARFARDPVR